MSDYLFSVIIPTYNRKQRISSAIESVLAQQGVKFEIIVVDDASTDGTMEWLTQEYANQPVRVLANNRRKGPAGARNTGMLAAKGEFIALLDSDDSFLPGHLQDCLRVFTDFPEVDVIFGRALYVQNGQYVDYMGANFERKLSYAPTTHSDETRKVFSDGFFSHLLQYGCYFNLSTVALRSTASKGLMNESLRIAEDYEFWVRLARSHRYACLSQPQITYALHDDNISFEQEGSLADNAPSVLTAYQIILAYPDLDKLQIRLVHDNMAEVLFSWGYRCRLHGKLLDSAVLHLRSFRYGMHFMNASAVAKLMLLAVLPGLARKSQ